MYVLQLKSGGCGAGLVCGNASQAMIPQNRRVAADWDGFGGGWRCAVAVKDGVTPSASEGAELLAAARLETLSPRAPARGRSSSWRPGSRPCHPERQRGGGAPRGGPAPWGSADYADSGDMGRCAEGVRGFSRAGRRATAEAAGGRGGVGPTDDRLAPGTPVGAAFRRPYRSAPHPFKQPGHRTRCPGLVGYRSVPIKGRRNAAPTAPGCVPATGYPKRPAGVLRGDSPQRRRGRREHGGRLGARSRGSTGRLWWVCPRRSGWWAGPPCSGFSLRPSASSAPLR